MGERVEVVPQRKETAPPAKPPQTLSKPAVPSFASKPEKIENKSVLAGDDEDDLIDIGSNIFGKNAFTDEDETAAKTKSEASSKDRRSTIEYEKPKESTSESKPASSGFSNLFGKKDEKSEPKKAVIKSPENPAGSL